tara:strand:+ start:5967 stop:6215 length:249 start_codon:yes stop_codon:yes gene_type:complete
MQLKDLIQQVAQCYSVEEFALFKKKIAPKIRKGKSFGFKTGDAGYGCEAMCSGWNGLDPKCRCRAYSVMWSLEDGEFIARGY